MTHQLLSYIVKKLLIRHPSGQKIKFCVLSTAAELEQIAAFRLEQYQRRLPYMLQELNSQGLDGFDARSLHIYLKDQQEILAVVRFSPRPFELESLYSATAIQKAINNKKLGKTVEISRLIVIDKEGYKGLMPALMLYCSIYLLCCTKYRYYISYCKMSNAEKFRGFRALKANSAFHIQARGEHQYLLYFGHVAQAMLEGIISAIQRKFKLNKK